MEYYFDILPLLQPFYFFFPWLAKKFNFLPAFNCTTWQLQLYHRTCTTVWERLYYSTSDRRQTEESHFRRKSSKSPWPDVGRCFVIVDIKGPRQPTQEGRGSDTSLVVLTREGMRVLGKANYLFCALNPVILLQTTIYEGKTPLHDRKLRSLG